MPRAVKPMFIAVLATAFALVGPAAISQARKHPPKPSLKIIGVAINGYDVMPGTTVTYQPNRPLNACYDIGGPSGAPYETYVVWLLHETGVPKNAKSTIAWTTPWDSYDAPNAQDPHAAFTHLWQAPQGQHSIAVASGEPKAPGYYYRIDGEFQGDGFDGHYTINATAKVNGRTLRAHGAITVNCG